MQLSAKQVNITHHVTVQLEHCEVLFMVEQKLMALIKHSSI